MAGDVKDVLLLDVTPLSLGIETMGGIMTTLISKNTTIPTKHSQVFSTAEDNQSAVTIHILQGERKRSSDNKSLGQFNLDGIQPAPRGIPQIEVTFDIDADGILHVSAKDKKTGREQKIAIQASSGLKEEEIRKMVDDAKMNEKFDQQFEELVKVKNQADQIIHSTKKQILEIKEKITFEEKKDVEKHLSLLEESVRTEDKKEIEKRIQDLIQITSKLLEKYRNKNSGDSQNSHENFSSKEEKKDKENVVDAEFEEVKK